MSVTEDKQGHRRIVLSNEMRRRVAAETDRIVREQIAREAEARNAQMARLREERLARESAKAQPASCSAKPAKRRVPRRIVVR